MTEKYRKLNIDKGINKGIYRKRRKLEGLTKELTKELKLPNPNVGWGCVRTALRITSLRIMSARVFLSLCIHRLGDREKVKSSASSWGHVPSSFP